MRYWHSSVLLRYVLIVSFITGYRYTLAEPPKDFPRFHFAGHEDAAALLSNFLWHHFDNRLGNGITLFNKEYLLTADVWLGNAIEKRRGTPIQSVHCENLLAVEITPEGYVQTHQHFSHAHDHGWPFPLWTQADTGPDGVAGKAAGWHFQNNGVPGWIGNYLRGWDRPEYLGDAAAAKWGVENAESLGIIDERWHVNSTGKSPTLTTPPGMSILTKDAPFVQLRWARSGT